VIVVDIACPACGAVEAVRKEGLAEYRCEACGETFTATDLD